MTLQFQTSTTAPVKAAVVTAPIKAAATGLDAILPSYAAIILADGPVAYWRLDDTGATATDLTGHGHTGALSGGVTKGVAGAIGDGNRAMKGDGVDGLITIPDAPELNFGIDSFSIEARLNFPTDASNPKWSLGKGNPYGNSVGDNGWALAHWTTVDPVSMQFYLSDGGVTGTPSGGGFWVYAGSPPRGSWHHLVISVDRAAYAGQGMAQSYLDAVPVSGPAFPVGFGTVTTVNPLTLLAGNGNPSTAAEDEVAIYPYALSAAQVLNHYAAAGRYIKAITSLTGKRQADVGVGGR